MRCFGVQYRCTFLLVLCIFTRPAGSSKYCRTRKNMQRYCTPKHPIRYIHIHRYGYGNSLMFCYVMLCYAMLYVCYTSIKTMNSCLGISLFMIKSCWSFVGAQNTSCNRS